MSHGWNGKTCTPEGADGTCCYSAAHASEVQAASQTDEGRFRMALLVSCCVVVVAIVDVVIAVA